MLKKDSQLLEEAYLSISKKTPSVPSDKETVITEPNEVVSAGPMDEPAPGVSMDMINSEVEDVEPEDKDTTGIPVAMTSAEMGDEHYGCGCGSEECDCEEAHEMALDNLNSIRESIMKIASHCASGSRLEAWAHQKLAIAMDNLAGIARSLH
jgi:hypothetical protein